MLQSTYPSVETRTSWVVASVVLLVMAVAFGAPWIGIVALKNIAAEVNGERSVPAFAGALMWIGSGLGGIVMGRVAERLGIRFTVIWRGDDRYGPCDLDAGAVVAALCRPWPVHGLPRHRRYQRAVLCLRQPVVRPPARLGAGADFERLLSRRRAVAAGFRARDRLRRVARNNVVFRGVRTLLDRACGFGGAAGAAQGASRSGAWSCA